MVTLARMVNFSKNILKQEFIVARDRGGIAGFPKDLIGDPVKVFAKEDRNGGIGLYVLDDKGNVFTPFYEQDGYANMPYCFDEFGEFSEKSCLITLSGAANWGSEFEWRKEEIEI